MIWIDLPSLQSIHLGWWTLRGKRDDDSSSLTMRSTNEMVSKWWNVDLPNLSSINSNGYSFNNPRSVTMESISEYWILMVFRYSKSSKYQSPWFVSGCPVEVNFEYRLIIWDDFIHRCFSHSRWNLHNQTAWSCRNKIMLHYFVKRDWPCIYHWVHTFHWARFIDYHKVNICFVSSFQTIYCHSLVIDLSSNLLFTLSFISIQIGPTNILQSYE